jgi:hypothetical protein
VNDGEPRDGRRQDKQPDANDPKQPTPRVWCTVLIARTLPICGFVSMKRSLHGAAAFLNIDEYPQLAELLLCHSRFANCHRIRHSEDRQQSRDLSVDELW